MDPSRLFRGRTKELFRRESRKRMHFWQDAFRDRDRHPLPCRPPDAPRSRQTPRGESHQRLRLVATTGPTGPQTGVPLTLKQTTPRNPTTGTARRGVEAPTATSCAECPSSTPMEGATRRAAGGLASPESRTASGCSSETPTTPRSLRLGVQWQLWRTFRERRPGRWTPALVSSPSGSGSRAVRSEPPSENAYRCTGQWPVRTCCVLLFDQYYLYVRGGVSPIV